MQKKGPGNIFQAACMYRCQNCGRFLTSANADQMSCLPTSSTIHHQGTVLPKHSRYGCSNIIIHLPCKELFNSFNLSFISDVYVHTGAQLGNFERGPRYICNGKDEIIHGLSPSVKCVAPLSIDISFAKV